MAATTTVITGATSGIGKETALALAKKGHALYLLVRDMARGDELVKQLVQQTGNREIYTIYCDLTSLATVYAAAEVLKGKLFAINVLINNAGGIFDHRQLSKDGFEMTFTVNHLAHFALTTTLMPLLIKGQARVINVSSDAHRFGKANFEDVQFEQNYSPFRVYGYSKLFNIYFTKSLVDKYGDKGLTAFTLHPGVVNTTFSSGLTGLLNVFFKLIKPFMISPEKGAETTIFIATQPTLHTKSGQYFIKKKVAKPAAAANDTEARERLWQLSEQMVSDIKQ